MPHFCCSLGLKTGELWVDFTPKSFFNEYAVVQRLAIAETSRENILLNQLVRFVTLKTFSSLESFF